MKVLAKDTKAGQWYEWQGGTRVLCCDKQRVWTRESETFILGKDIELTHLPDCTGWDWQSPKPEKKYRPFATWQEWWPHRDRFRRGGVIGKACWVGADLARQDFEDGYSFLNDDGTDAEPFGIEVTE